MKKLTLVSVVIIMTSFLFNSSNTYSSNLCKTDKAGTWYSENPAKLDKELNEFLQQANLTTNSKPRMIIVPHPGLMYGGPTAAYAFKLASQYTYRNIFIIATSHLANFKGAIIGDYDEYQTPFGPLSGNRDITSYLLHKSEAFKFIPELIQKEHCFEMQYPFIKKLMPEAKIIPIVLSSPDPQMHAEITELIYSAITPDDLIIISTDLSHYPTYEDAKVLDLKTLEAIKNLNPQTFADTVDRLTKQAPANTSTVACGAVGILMSLNIAEKLGIKEAEILHYENSGDRPFGDKSQVVGYGAVALFAPEVEQYSDTVKLTKSERDQLLAIARKTIASILEEKDPPLMEVKIDNPLPKELGVFVTINKNGNLRSCMGIFESTDPLFKIVQHTAILSAFKDPRFPPLSKEELSKVTLSISVLGQRKTINDWKEIIPGKHGVYVKKGYLSGTYLPQVAPEQGWDREEMMNSLCAHKSGMEKDAWKNGSAELSTYTALVFSEK